MQTAPPLPAYHSILLATDSSDHANRATRDAVALADPWGARVTGVHVYAAKLHDLRFRQMEGGLPEHYRNEQELEHQRDVHDDLITRGLGVITDSYLDQVARACEQSGVSYARRSLEGKNYRALIDEADRGDYDLMMMGALGLGAAAPNRPARPGTVCLRTVRRAPIDILVIKDPNRTLAEGPIVVGVDGSSFAWGGLLTALALARHWQVPVQAIAAFDPYFHTVAFNRIAGVLSEEAGKVFRLEEQERLHEELIDGGLARIYDGHLSVAKSIAQTHGLAIETRLLAGKPSHAIQKHIEEVNASLLIIGRIGIHADAELDIGGTAENLLHDANCAVLFSRRQFQPEIDRVTEITTTWTPEAEARMERVPGFVRDMARRAILRYGHERGHTVITERLVEEATATMMSGHRRAPGDTGTRQDDSDAEPMQTHPRHRHEPPPETVGSPSHPRCIEQNHQETPVDPSDPCHAQFTLPWSDEAARLLQTIGKPSLRAKLTRLAEEKARKEKDPRVQQQHLLAFFGPRQSAEAPHDRKTDMKPHWQAAALARLMRVPEGAMRDASRRRIEHHTHERNLAEVDLPVVEQVLAESREVMNDSIDHHRNEDGPFPEVGPEVGPETNPETSPPETEETANHTPPWTADAHARLQAIPEGFGRDATRRAISIIAQGKGLHEIDSDLVQSVLDTLKAAGSNATETLPWDEKARTHMMQTLAPIRGTHIKAIVRGILIRDIETRARQEGLGRVTQSLAKPCLEPT
uniref:Nucleotide-binding universal stress protein, UspA family n=1 Tax=Candidatus Kentrum sp. LFY TaxID=2126342 RepID=A0A450UK37_9GAMM|nr:MAG: Nucleotide-binding universal stress protein, UspA family [Candidatus Kentron sp. LFY]